MSDSSNPTPVAPLGFETLDGYQMREEARAIVSAKQAADYRTGSKSSKTDVFTTSVKLSDSGGAGLLKDGSYDLTEARRQVTSLGLGGSIQNVNYSQHTSDGEVTAVASLISMPPQRYDASVQSTHIDIRGSALRGHSDGRVTLDLNDGNTIIYNRDITREASQVGITAAAIRLTQQGVASSGEITHNEQRFIDSMINKAKEAAGFIVR